MIPLIMIGGTIVFFISYAAWIYIHHKIFGLFWGNSLFCVEMITVSASVVSGYFLGINKKHIAAAICIINVAVLSVGLIWWANPEQAYFRATDRAYKIESDLRDFSFDNKNIHPEKAEKATKWLEIELHARQLEAEAAKVRAFYQ